MLQGPETWKEPVQAQQGLSLLASRVPEVRKDFSLSPSPRENMKQLVGRLLLYLRVSSSCSAAAEPHSCQSCLEMMQPLA